MSLTKPNSRAIFEILDRRIETAVVGDMSVVFVRVLADVKYSWRVADRCT
jgi:hypothetical protein